MFDRETGKVGGGVDHNYACCRFAVSGPAIDSRECLGAVVSNGRLVEGETAEMPGFSVLPSLGRAA